MNKILEAYSIVNNLFISGILKIFILVVSLYIFSQKYQGYMLTVIGIMGCIWVFESYFLEYRLMKLEEKKNGRKTKGIH